MYKMFLVSLLSDKFMGNMVYGVSFPFPIFIFIFIAVSWFCIVTSRILDAVTVELANHSRYQ
jgi:hypothetical protein